MIKPIFTPFIPKRAAVSPIAVSLLFAAGFLILLIPGTCNAIDPGEQFGSPVSTAAYVSFTSVSQGGTAKIAVELEIKHPWHINAHELTDEFLLPTEIVFHTPEGIEIKNIVYPKPVEKRLDFSEDLLQLYDGTVYIGAVIEVSPDFPIGKTSVRASLSYQACDNQKCLMPAIANVIVSFDVSSRRESIDLAHTDIFSKIDFGGAVEEGGSQSGSDGGFGSDLAGRGMLIAFLLVFAGGLALNLTPCVYPIIPITVGYFGGQASGSKGNTIVLAILYVLGLAAMYSALGVVAALTGSILGSSLQNPFVTAFIALVLIGLSLSMFGLYEIRVPARLSGVAGTAKKGYVGAFLMGLTVGIVAAPCIGPFVLGLLTFVGERGDPALGFAMFFTLAMGLGLPYVFLAVASGSITKLPGSGGWMEWIRKLFGVILLAMAVYFLDPLLPDAAYYILMGGLLVVCGVILGFALRVTSTSMFFSVFRRAVGVLMPLAGLWFVFAPGHIFGVAPSLPWVSYSNEALAEAKSNRTPVVIDFSAEWCIPCKELDHETFDQPEVIEAAKRFVPLRADLTKTGSPQVAEVRKKFEIRGVPTIVFIDSNGNERKELRAVHFINKEEFLEKLRLLKE